MYECQLFARSGSEPMSAGQESFCSKELSSASSRFAHAREYNSRPSPQLSNSKTSHQTSTKIRALFSPTPSFTAPSSGAQIWSPCQPSSLRRPQPDNTSWICSQQPPSHRFSRINLWLWMPIWAKLLIGLKIAGERPWFFF